MDQHGRDKRASFESRILAVDEDRLRRVEAETSGKAHSNTVNVRSEAFEAVPFRNVFANHFNNVIRSR